MNSVMSLYHCNENSIVDEVLVNNEKIDLLKSRKDKYWLGTGIYFWDNLGNAKYWKENKEQKNKDKIYSILKVCVCLDSALNLTDPDVGRQFERVINLIIEYMPCVNIKKIGFGEKIDFISENFPKYMKDYEVIIADGYYANSVNKIFPTQKNKYFPRLTEKNKRIYNVIKQNAIVSILGKEVV